MSDKFNRLQPQLRVPCCYQGGKQRVSKELVDRIFDTCSIDETTRFYDLCCGSGAYTVELLNKGIRPENITMLDKSSWGVFWRAVGLGAFDTDTFKEMLNKIPEDKREVKQHVSHLAEKPIGEDECYVFLLLQACSFGGKQIWNDGKKWHNAFFRDYWEPKEGSVRKSPANPMQPSPKTLLDRLNLLVEKARGVSCVHEDISWILSQDVLPNSVVYMDPPYRKTTGYAFGFDVDDFITKFKARSSVPFFVSEGMPLSDDAVQLSFGGAKGGISGNKSSKHQEWLSRIE